MEQKTFVTIAKRLLGVGGYELAQELGVSRRTFDKWMTNPASKDFRAMPLMAARFIARLLQERKRDFAMHGDRENLELIDALLAQVDEKSLAESCRIFDGLQKSADDFVSLSRLSGKPVYFRDIKEKNFWDEEEVISNAKKQLGQAAAHAQRHSIRPR